MKLLEKKSFFLFGARQTGKTTLVRQTLPGVKSFLDFLALTNGEELNKAAIAQDSGIPARTASQYRERLYDTLLAYELPAFTLSKKRSAIRRSKFYFFDLGVAAKLAKRSLIENHSELFGKAFEHFIINEVRAYNSYRRKHFELSFWRTKNGFEVDLIVDRRVAIEIKSTKMVQQKHLKGLKALQEEGICSQFIVVSQDDETRILKDDKILILPWKDFCQELWNDRLF